MIDRGAQFISDTIHFFQNMSGTDRHSEVSSMREQLYWPLQKCNARPQVTAVLINTDCAKSVRTSTSKNIKLL
jgi:hypothetical protein